MTDLYADYRSGSTEPWTVGVLCALVRAKKPHVLIETGTFEGRTTLKLAEAIEANGTLHGALLFTVESDPVRMAEARQRLAEFQTQWNIGLMPVEADALAFLKQQGNESADFIFLDDDHGAEHVYQEIGEALRILRPGGICCVHDVVGIFGLDKVVQSYGGIVLDLPRLHAAGGLGLLTK